MQAAMTDQESPDRISYQCNVCAGINEFVEVTTLDRETGQCRHCHAQVRLRAIVHLISKAMFGQSMPVKYWPENTGIKGMAANLTSARSNHTPMMTKNIFDFGILSSHSCGSQISYNIPLS